MRICRWSVSPQPPLGVWAELGQLRVQVAALFRKRVRVRVRALESPPLPALARLPRPRDRPQSTQAFRLRECGSSVCSPGSRPSCRRESPAHERLLCIPDIGTRWPSALRFALTRSNKRIMQSLYGTTMTRTSLGCCLNCSIRYVDYGSEATLHFQGVARGNLCRC